MLQHLQDLLPPRLTDHTRRLFRELVGTTLHEYRPHHLLRLVWTLVGLVVGGLDAGMLGAADAGDLPFRRDRFLVLPRDGAGGPVLTELHARHHVEIERWFPTLDGLQILRVPETADLQTVLQDYRKSPEVAFAELDYLVHWTVSPNDPRFGDGNQWGLHNSGQQGGLPDADIDAPEAWDLRSDASDVIVAVVDSGVWTTHEDLADNLWVNPGEIAGNSVDDEGNGYVDDVHGLNALTGTGAIGDAAGHGTHLAGIIGAVGNNGKGIAGLAWKVQIMPCRFIGPGGSGSVSDAITCLEYARSMGARIINASWVTTNASAGLELAVAKALEGGVLIVAGAGNDSADIDRVPYYPASLPFDNILCVAASDCRDRLWDRSNFGAVGVDLVAPGVNIDSTFFIANNNYVSMTGTSQAAAFVAGAAALVWAAWPAATYGEVIDRLLYGSDPVPAFHGACQSGARLNLRGALEPSPPPVWPLAPVVSTGHRGGPFVHEKQVFVVLNRGGSALGWSSEADESWLDISPCSGTIAPAERATVTVTVNDEARGLPEGRHLNRIEFLLQPGDQRLEVLWTLDIYRACLLRISRPDPIGTPLVLSLTGHPDATYVAEASPNLKSWGALATNTLPTNGELPCFCTVPRTARLQYYRACVVSPP